MVVVYSFYLIFLTGDNGLKELTLRTSKKFPSSKWGVSVNKTDGAEWEKNFLIYFPSLRTVKESKGRAPGAGTICFQSKWYHQHGFPQQAMRDNRSRRNGVLMHSKVCPGVFARMELDSNVSRCYLYDRRAEIFSIPRITLCTVAGHTSEVPTCRKVLGKPMVFRSQNLLLSESGP